MDSNRIMLEITDPYPTQMEIPNGLNASYRGRIPRSVVLYTGSGILLSRLHEQTIQERKTFIINDNTIGYILTLLVIEPGDHLEFERHSNTDVIVRAYDEQGQEKNSRRNRTTRMKVHYRIQVHSGFQNSLDMSTALTPPLATLGPNQIGLMTVLGHHWVTGASEDDRYRLYGHTWESFQRRHQLKQGMILVFKKDPHNFNFKVFFYNADGSEATAISRKSAGFGPAGMSFYKYPHEINMDSNELRLGRRFVEMNWNLLTHGVRIVTEDGIFNMKYERNSHYEYAITRNWNTIFWNFSAEKNLVFKFFMSFDNNRVLRSGRCTIFVVAFKGNGHHFPEISIEVSGDPLCSSDEDSICTQNLS